MDAVMLAPHELKSKSFSKSLKGYNPSEVDDYIEFLIDKYTELYRENSELERKLRIVVTNFDEIRDEEEAIRSTLLKSQKLGEKIIRDANERADVITGSIKERCDAIISSFREQLRAEKNEMWEIRTRIIDFKKNLYDIYRQHIEELQKLSVNEIEDIVLPDENEIVGRIFSDVRETIQKEIISEANRRKEESLEEQPAADAGEAAKPQPGSPKLLTLVIATYNMERYIGRCLDSVTAPEIPSTLEVIAVNDGSTDRSLEIMESYRKRRPDIVRVIDKPNGHYGSCINAGLQAATGKYFRPLDADDWMDTQALADLLSRLERCDTDLVVTLRTEHRIRENGAMSVTRFPFKGIEYGHAYPLASFDIPGHIKGEEFNMHSMAYKTSLLREVGLRQDEGICYTDFQYCFLPIDRAKDFVVFDLYLYQYFIGREEQSTDLQSIRNNFPHICKVIEYMLRYMDATPGTGGIIRKNQIYFVKKALDIFVVSLRWQSPVTKARYKEILRILQAVERYHIQNRLLDKIYFRPWRKHPTRSILNATLLIYQAVHARRYRKARKKKR